MFKLFLGADLDYDNENLKKEDRDIYLLRYDEEEIVEERKK